MSNSNDKLNEIDKRHKELKSYSEADRLKNKELKPVLEGNDSDAVKNNKEDTDEESQIPGANNLW